MGLFALNLLIVIVCAGSMSFLFPLFNLIQLLTLLPLLELYLPQNLKTFISDYLQFANFHFGFFPNPVHNFEILDLSEVNIDPYTQKFAENDIHSRSLIVNYGEQLMFWTIMISLYIPITFFAKCCKIKKFQELKRAYEYGVLITSFSEAFLEFTLLSVLNLTKVICSFIYT